MGIAFVLLHSQRAQKEMLYVINEIIYLYTYIMCVCVCAYMCVVVCGSYYHEKECLFFL